MDPNLTTYATMADDDDYDPRKPEYVMSTSKEQMEHMNNELLKRQIAQLEMFVEKRLGASRAPSKSLQHYNQVCAELRQARPRRLSTPNVTEELRQARPRQWSTPTVTDIDSPSLSQYDLDTGDAIREDTEVAQDSPKKVQTINKSVEWTTGRFTMKSCVQCDTPPTEYDPSPTKNSFLDDSLSTDYNPTVASSIASDDAQSTADDHSECRSSSVDFVFDAWTAPGTPGPYTPPNEPVTPTMTFAAGSFVKDCRASGQSMELNLEQSMQLDMEPKMQPFTPIARCVADYEAFDQIMGQSVELDSNSPKWASNKEIESAVLAYLEGKSQYDQSKEQIMEIEIEPVSPQWGSSNENRIAPPHPVPSTLAFKSERVSPQMPILPKTPRGLAASLQRGAASLKTRRGLAASFQRGRASLLHEPLLSTRRSSKGFLI